MHSPAALLPGQISTVSPAFYMMFAAGSATLCAPCWSAPASYASHTTPQEVNTMIYKQDNIHIHCARHNTMPYKNTVSMFTAPPLCWQHMPKKRKAAVPIQSPHLLSGKAAPTSQLCTPVKAHETTIIVLPPSSQLAQAGVIADDVIACVVIPLSLRCPHQLHTQHLLLLQAA